MRILLAASIGILLGGCTHNSKPISLVTPSTQIMTATQSVQNNNATLWEAGAVNEVRNAWFTPGINAHSQRVMVDWDGDAVELLSHLARQRGVTFNWTGVRLPLPVNLHVNGVTYQNLLRMIEVQTAWRATLHEFPGQLTLVFSQPEKPRGRR
ncbi:DotD/TraH family lipoprotein [Serratia marcescens]|uniref:DotD/TraH family lipoprotein n=1 Tax=Serratia TaxID=613 RepID=UPI00163DB617|nr:DotD/TraH family lipoprotein [Serratia marcescens]